MLLAISYIAIWGFISGVRLLLQGLQSLCTKWVTEYEVPDFQFRAVLACDNEPAVQAHLLAQHGMNLLCTRVEDLLNDRVMNLVSTRIECVRPCDIFHAGFVCKDISMMNSQRKKNKGCIRNQTGKTGGTFAALLGYVKKHRPFLTVLENVPSTIWVNPAYDHTRWVAKAVVRMQYT